MIKELIKNVPRDLSGVNDLIERGDPSNQTECLYKEQHVKSVERLLIPVMGHPRFKSATIHIRNLREIRFVSTKGISLKTYEQGVEIPCLQMTGEYDQIYQGINLDINELLERILSFKTLKESWNGYGALPLEAKSASNAIYLLTKLSDNIKSKISNIRPNPNGTISFEWENHSDERLVSEIGNSFMSYYLKLNSNTPHFENNVSFDDQSIHKMGTMVKKLFL